MQTAALLAAPPAHGEPRFARSLTLTDVFCLGVNAIVGSGIFLFPGKLAAASGPASIFAFLACGLLLTTVALCYAELGSMYRRNGGAYIYAREAFGPYVGFAVGWIAWVTAVFSWAAVATGIPSYLGHFLPGLAKGWPAAFAAAGIVLFFGGINYFGVKLGALTVNFFTLAKLLPLTLFVALGLFHISPANFQPMFTLGAAGFGHAVFLTLWPLQGFETTPVAAGETRRPQRDVPLAAVGSLLFATGFYTLIQIVAVGTFPGLAASERPLAEAGGLFMGAMGATLMAGGAIVSMTGFNAGSALGSPRYLDALAEDGYLPRALSEPHARYGTPAVAIAATTAITAVMALFLPFDRLVDISNLAVISQYLSACLAVVALRYRQPAAERPFRLPLGPAIPIVGIVISIWLASQVKWLEVGVAAATVLVGFAVWGVYRLAARA